MTPFEANLDRLLREAYQPETPDPAFVSELQERLRATARERAIIQASERRVTRIRLGLGWAMAAAALAVTVVLVQRARQPAGTPGISPMMTALQEFGPTPPEQLTAQPKAPAPAAKALAVGESLRTAAGQKQRVTLPDGSVVFVNAGTSLKLESPRRLVLDQGEIFVEVAPKPDERFVVQTPDKTVTALGTKFTVHSEEKKTSVAVTQGKVQVSGLDVVLLAGEQLLPDERKPTPAPRATELLEWTRDLLAQADSPLAPVNSYGSGKLVAFDWAGQEAKISLRQFHLDVHIEDGFARTTIDQTYFNHESAQLEGTFYFPLPPDASISRLAMYVNGELMEGGMAERDHARDTFEQIRYTRRDPALLEWLDGNTFKMRVFPLEGRQEKRIILSYTQRLPMISGKMSYRFPAGHDLRVVDDWSARVRIVDGVGLPWTCATHKLQAATEGTSLVLTDTAKGARLDRDLQVNFIDHQSPATRFSSAEMDGFKYVMVRYRPEIARTPLTPGPSPPEAGGEGRMVGHCVILFETSGDRDPLLARTQIEILRTILNNLEHGDMFQIVTAGTHAKLVSEKPMTATAENIKSAIGALEKVHLVGALDLASALETCAKLAKGQGNAWLIHLGSGIPALGQRRDDELVKLLPKEIRYAGVGVGKRFGRTFMRAAAERTGGHYTQINPDETVGWRALDFLATLRLPRWQEIRVTDDAGGAWLVSEPSVGAGEELCAVTRFAKEAKTPPADAGGSRDPKTVTIRAMLNGEPIERTLKVEKIADKAGYIPRTWGKLEIDRLVAADSAGNKAKIIDLSKSLYVMSPFTSLLVLENAEMYARFKIDRGRKDHWALYACPDRIPVKVEPATPADPVIAGRRPAKEVLESIVVRSAADEKYNIGFYPPALGLVVRERVKMRPYVREPRPIFGGRFSERGIDDRSRAEDLGEVDKSVGGKRVFPRPRGVVAGLSPVGTLTPDLDIPLRSSSFNNSVPPLLYWNDSGKFSALPTSFGGWGGQGGFGGFGGNNGGFAGQGGFNGVGIGGGSFSGQGGFGGANGFGMGGQVGFGAGQLGVNGARNWNGPAPNFLFSLQEGKPPLYGQFGFQGFGYQWIDGWALPLNYRTPLTNQILRDDLAGSDFTNDGYFRIRSAQPALVPGLLVQTPNAQQVNWRMLCADLVAFAPGMETSAADVLATLEAEASDLAIKLGRIDDKARALIERSRQTGWRSHRLGGVTITFDGAGRFAFSRTLPTGLREIVINDGQSLVHLYPEIGVGAKRVMSRAYRAEFASFLPGALPPVEDLAVGADIIAVDEHTVAIVPLGEKKLEVRLVFGGGGKLIERHFVEAGKTVLTEKFDKTKPATAPDLKPDTSKLVVLPLPYRSVAWAQSRVAAKAKDADYAELAARFAGNGEPAWTLCDYLNQKRHDFRALPGLITLLHSAGDQRVFTDLNESLNRPLCEYIKQVVQEQRIGVSLKSSEGLLPRLGKLHDLAQYWLNVSPATVRSRRDELWKETRDFVEKNRSNLMGWLAVTLAGQDRGYSQTDWRSAAELWQLFENDPEHGYVARYQRVACLLRGGQPQTARMVFDDLYRKTLAAGVVPPLDETVKQLPASEDGVTWEALLIRTAGELVAKDRAGDALAVAEQALALGGPGLGWQVFALIAPQWEKLPLALRFAACIFLARLGDRSAAEESLRELLRDEQLAKEPIAWRLAADLAGQGGSAARKAAALERALDLEFKQLPEAIDVQALRQDYETLLAAYAELASACRSADVLPPKDLVARVIKFADRWRSLDPDPTPACHAASRALRILNEPALAWEYLTTPMAAAAGDSAPLRKLATELQASGELDLAQRALGAAFGAEPTDAQLLWDRATILQQIGKSREAVPLLQKLADGNWQPRFENLKQQARWALSH